MIECVTHGRRRRPWGMKQSRRLILQGFWMHFLYSYAPAPGSLRGRRHATVRPCKNLGAAHPNGHKVGHFGDFRLCVSGTFAKARRLQRSAKAAKWLALCSDGHDRLLQQMGYRSGENGLAAIECVARQNLRCGPPDWASVAICVKKQQAIPTNLKIEFVRSGSQRCSLVLSLESLQSVARSPN